MSNPTVIAHPSDILFKYFPELATPEKAEKVKEAFAIYKEWNEKINVISRKDIDSFYEKHVLHSLAIAKFILRVVDKSFWKILAT